MVAIQNLILAIAASAVVVQGHFITQILKRELSVRGATSVWARGMSLVSYLTSSISPPLSANKIHFQITA